MRINLFTLLLAHEEDLQKARSRIRQVAVLLGLSTVDKAHLATAATEIARNALMYAGGGTLEIHIDKVAEVPLLIARVSDRGGGISKIDEILSGRSRMGLGGGLAGSKRLMDLFLIDTHQESGTTVTLGKALPATAPPLTDAYGKEMRGILEQQSSSGVLEDVKTQSQDLLAALGESRTHQEELARLNLELDQTNRGVIALYAELDEKAKTLERSTERLTLELAERIKLEALLLQSQKLDAIGQLTGGVAHDFNNILMVIMANVEELLEDDETVDPKLHLQRISGATERATQLTRQLLSFSRKQTLRLQPTNINDLVVTTGALLRRTLGAHIEIDSLLADQLWQINTDRAQMEAALVNLCINARDAMPTGGRLLVETRNATLDADYVAHNPGAMPGDYVLLSVTDTGTGISPEVLSKVFEPFFTTKETGKGTGLGLSMVYGFVKQSKGHIAIYSEVGHGTAVKLYLPRSESLEASEAPVAPIVSPRGTERILVVEDGEHVREIVVQQLIGLGYNVTEAANGTEALATLSTERAFDLMLTDVIMPGQINGKALADEATALSPSMHVLFMSGYSEDVISTFGILNQGVTLLSKPFRKVDLAIAVRRVLDSSY